MFLFSQVNLYSLSRLLILTTKNEYVCPSCHQLTCSPFVSKKLRPCFGPLHLNRSRKLLYFWSVILRRNVYHERRIIPSRSRLFIRWFAISGCFNCQTFEKILVAQKWCSPRTSRMQFWSALAKIFCPKFEKFPLKSGEILEVSTFFFKVLHETFLWTRRKVLTTLPKTWSKPENSSVKLRKSLKVFIFFHIVIFPKCSPGHEENSFDNLAFIS